MYLLCPDGARKNQFPPPRSQDPEPPEKDPIFVTAPENPKAAAAKPKPQRVDPPSRELYPPLKIPDLNAPSTLKDISNPVTYVCVIPRKIYQDKIIESAISSFYSYIIQQNIPVKLQECGQMTAEMKQVPLLPCIVAHSVTKSIRDAYTKASIPGKCTLG